MNKIPNDYSMAQHLWNIAEKYHDRPALWAAGKSYSYAEMSLSARKLALFLSKNSHKKRCAFLCEKGFHAYVSIWACLFAGLVYVPMNLKDPHIRIRDLLKAADVDVLIVDHEGLRMAETLSLGDLGVQTLICHDEIEANFEPLLDLMPSHQFVYLLFTSGSTGMPKGVLISNHNLRTYVNNMIERCRPNQEDRFTQMTELTFDFSVHDMYVAWSVGACLYAITDKYFLNLKKFAATHRLSFWASVPSTLHLLDKLKQLGPGAFSSIRYSVFCGEAFTKNHARLWHYAAPHSIIDNLYGPTEATVAFTGYICTEGDLQGEEHSDDILPIGKAFSKLETFVLDENLEAVSEGVTGELYLVGDQVCRGYWQHEALTNSHFKQLVDGRTAYKTGDLVLYDPEVGLLYKGRLQDQFKINGYRVERLEVELALKKHFPQKQLAVVAVKTSQKDILVAFVERGENFDRVKRSCLTNLPSYMVPGHWIDINALPINQNGKIDYKKLTELAHLNLGGIECTELA